MIYENKILKANFVLLLLLNVPINFIFTDRFEK